MCHCPICIEENRNDYNIILSCKHIFHSTCIREWFSISNKYICPLCRAVIDLSNDITYTSSNFVCKITNTDTILKIIIHENIEYEIVIPNIILENNETNSHIIKDILIDLLNNDISQDDIHKYMNKIQFIMNNISN